jgi:hypothetical protein
MQHQRIAECIRLYPEIDGAGIFPRSLVSTVARKVLIPHSPDAGHDLAFGQIAVAHHDFGLNSLGQKCSCSIAQNLRQRISKTSWLAELERVTIGHGDHSLAGEGEASSTPTIRRLTPSCRHQLAGIAHQ